MIAAECSIGSSDPKEYVGRAIIELSRDDVIDMITAKAKEKFPNLDSITVIHMTTRVRVTL